MKLTRLLKDMGTAFQFLTRVPIPRLKYDPEALSRSAKFFPLVGLAIGAAAALLFSWLSSHLPATVASLFTVCFTVLATGALHEDGLADAADAFGGGRTREQVLIILKDSRIGSYGALAIAFSVVARTLLLASLPRIDAAKYIVSAHVLSRWTVLPLGYVMPPASAVVSQGARLARHISVLSVCAGTLVTLAVVRYLLHRSAFVPALVAFGTTVLTGMYYQRRINGVTGDCFGATTQLTEIGIYFAGVWHG